MTATTIILASLWLVAALQSSTVIEQVAPTASPSTVNWPAQQVLIDGSVPAKPKVDETVQLAKKNAAPQEASQLTVEKSGGQVAQAGTRDRNTQSAPDLSTRKQGFETRVVKLEGTDKCSAELLSARDREYCQRVIENRSAEYLGPKQADLSPEQKLLAGRNSRLLDGGTDGAIKRLANGRSSPEDSDDQAVASIVLGEQTGPAPSANAQSADAKLSADTQALIDAIVKNVSGNPGP